MSVFREKQRHHRYKETWVLDVTEKDLDNLPIVLLGLSDIKNFPIPIEKRYKGPKLLKKFPHLQFYYSKLTGRRMAAGVAIGDPIENEIINNSNIIYNYQEIPNTNETNQIKDYAVQVNYNLESIPDEVMKQINEITSELEANQSYNQIHTIEDIINNTETETDYESKKLIESMIEKDEKEHAGRDEAIVYLVKHLQADCENEIKSEQQEP